MKKRACTLGRVPGTAVLLALLCLHGGPARAAAAEADPDSISPKEREAVAISADPYFEAELRPGERAARDIALRNLGARPLRVRVEVCDYAQDERANAVTRPAGSLPAGAGSWLTVAPGEFVLPPGSAQKVRAAVRVPPATPTGTFGAAIFFAADAGDEVPQEMGTRVIAKVGTLVLVSVRGTTPMRESGTITGWRLPAVVLWRPAPVGLRYRNTGNVRSQASARMRLEPLWGGPPLTVEMGARRVLPGAEVAFDARIPEGPAVAAYRVSLAVNNGTGAPLAELPGAGTVVVCDAAFAGGILASALGGAIASLALRRQPGGRPVPATVPHPGGAGPCGPAMPIAAPGNHDSPGKGVKP